MSPSQLDEPDRQGQGTLQEAMSVGYSIIGAFIVFGAAGYLLDRWLDTAPWIFIVSVVAGAAIALFLVNRLQREQTHP